MLVADRRDAGADGLPGDHRAQGALPAAGHRPASPASPRRRRTSRSRRCGARRRRSTRSCTPIPTSRTSLSFIGRRAAAPATPARCSSRCKPARRAQGTADEIIARLRPKLARGPRHHAVPAVGAGRARRRPRVAHAVPVHAAGRQPRRAARPGRPRCCERCASCPSCSDVEHRSADRRASSSTSTSIATRAARLGITPADDRRHALRRLRPAPGRDVVHARSTSTASCWRRRPSSAGQPRPAGARLRARRRAARWCRCRHRASSASAPTPLSINHQGQFPAMTLSFNLAPRRRARAGRRRRSTRAERADRPAGQRPRQLPGHGAGLRRLARQRAVADPRGAVHRLHRARHALREPHPPDHDPLDAAVGGARRAARAAACCSVEFSIIALIGIILLIGIVKKNAIMMIDFALEAERDEGLDPKTAIHQAVPAALPADPDDHAGGAARRAAAGARPRRRLRAAPPARHQPSSAASASRRC